MMQFGGNTPKRSMVVSNSCAVGGLDRGTLRRRAVNIKKKNQTTRRYIDGSQKARFTGAPGLKKSQKLVSTLSLNSCGWIDSPMQLPRSYPVGFAKELISMFVDIIEEPRPVPSNKEASCHLFVSLGRNFGTPAQAVTDEELRIRVGTLQWSSWPEANVVEALLYVRKSQRLVIPEAWKALVPSAEEIAKHLDE